MVARKLSPGETIGAPVAVFHPWGMPTSDEQIERNLAVLSECIDIAEAYSLEPAVETIPCAKSTPLVKSYSFTILTDLIRHSSLRC